MSQSNLTNQNATLISSATNFDLPSLHILCHEINSALKNAETHLSEFNDDEEQAPLLLDSVDVMQQLARILDLLSLDGGSDLTQAIADTMQLLYDNGDNADEDLILDISEAIMTLDRYIEFVLLKETLEPTLLMNIINKLYVHLGKDALDEDSFSRRDSTSISISNPEKNFQALSELDLDVKLLSAAYRAGLEVVLGKTNSLINDKERQKLMAMQSACQLISSKTKSLFWQAATAVVTNIEQVLPLKNSQKRILIFLEQQFNNYLSINDRRFADLVSLACQRNNSLSVKIKEEYANNRLDEASHEKMRRFLFGPNHEVTDTLNEIIQDKISTVKDNVDALVRGFTDGTETEISTDQIASDLRGLSSSMYLLNLEKAAESLINEAKAIENWQTPTPEDFDILLTSLIVAENASIQMSKQHTPGAMNIALHNNTISLHQLNASYKTITVQSRTNIANIEQIISNYMADESHNVEHLTRAPDLLRQVAGSLNFLNLKDGGQMLSRLAKYIEVQMIESDNNYDENVMALVADVIMAADHYLEGLESNRPVGKLAMNVGHHSLNQLLAVA